MGSTFRDTGYMDTETEIVVVQGAGYQQFWALQLDDGTTYDTTGHTAQMQVRLTPDAETALATYSTPGGPGKAGRILVGQTVGPYTGCLLLNLNHTDTAELPGGLVAGYDLILITPAGQRVPFAAQRFCVQDAYTEVS